jgi:Tfp pilus assembly protein PilN
MRKGKPLAILPNSIEIQGSTTINNDLSQWINALEKKEFVKEVSIKDLDKKGRFTNFNLTIVLGS